MSEDEAGQHPTPASIDRIIAHADRAALLSRVSCRYEELIQRCLESGHEAPPSNGHGLAGQHAAAILEVTRILRPIDGLLSRARAILEDL